MPRKKIHVVPYGGGWAVKREGADRASKITDTKSEAIEEARKLAYRNDDEVIVHDKGGKITKGKRYGKKEDDGGCFLTSACVIHFKLSDNCYQLSTLRSFRDNYLQHTAKGKKLVTLYYSIAPKIVQQLNTHPDRNNLYKNIFQQINFACALIENRKHKEAENLYVNIVTYLAKQFQLA